jgi:predicted sulfurtransferase
MEASVMKRIIICLGVLVLLFMRYAAQAQAEIQNTGPVPNKVEAEARKGGYQLVTPEELKKEYLTDPASFLLVDTRQEWSYQMQHIKGALHIDFTPTWWNQYSPMMRSAMKSLLGPDKNKKIVFY